MTHSETLEHYGPPPDGCEKDEMAFQIQGIPGGICAAKCTNFMPCPKDLPVSFILLRFSSLYFTRNVWLQHSCFNKINRVQDGVTAQPQCALKDQSGNTYCVLVCAPSSNSNLRVGDEQCGKATCQPVQGQGVGICTYS